jgi:hypothetical protein
MKSTEQRKAELCDTFFHLRKVTSGYSDLMNDCIEKYNKITQQKPLSQDPYCDEVFSGRLVTFLTKHLKDYPKQLSECPTIQELVHSHVNGFGRKSRKEYIDVMTAYEMFDKI